MTLNEILKEEISKNAHHVGFLVQMHVSQEHLDIVMQDHYDEISRLCDIYDYDAQPYYEYYKQLCNVSRKINP